MPISHCKPCVEICKKSMMHNPDLRYQSAKELAEDIQNWLDGAHKREKGLKQIEKAKQAKQRSACNETPG